MKGVKTSSNPMMKPCDGYVSQPEVYQFCISEYARHLPNIGGVEITCSLAGPWESDCRNAWVLQQIHNGMRDIEILLRGCGDNKACYFDVFDNIKAVSFQVQMERCDRLSSSLGYHCREHTLELWRVEEGSAEEVAWLLESLESVDEQAIRFAASVIACSNIGQCSGKTDVERACSRMVALYERGELSCQWGGIPNDQSTSSSSTARTGEASAP